MTTTSQIDDAKRNMASILLQIRGFVPQVQKTCAVSGEKFTAPCKEWDDLYWTSGLTRSAVTAKRLAALEAVAPDAYRLVHDAGMSVLSLMLSRENARKGTRRAR